MYKAELGEEVLIKAVNDIGVLAEITRIIAERGISILSISSWVEGIHGMIHLMTDDNEEAREALTQAGLKVKEGGVVTVEILHTPGMLNHLTEKIKTGGFDIQYLYATAASGHGFCRVVFACSDNSRAAAVLKEA